MSKMQLTALVKNTDGQDVRVVAFVDAPLVWNVMNPRDGAVERDKSPLAIEEWLINSPNGRTLSWHPLPIKEDDEAA